MVNVIGMVDRHEAATLLACPVSDVDGLIGDGSLSVVARDERGGPVLDRRAVLRLRGPVTVN